ncbi:MAG TPA: hypothetical protein VHX38_02305 [Pseudonocardiaceae bacterium]|jgi:hypothetical protein|nr:hypothetical protein [Pseudonocardiaceae bacterium]
MTITWKRPAPRATNKRINWAEVDRELRAQPHEWALVGRRGSVGSAGTMACELRWGASRGWGKPRHFYLEPGAFEIEQRDVDVYARFVGAA